MLHILLLILKITGIIFAVILGILVLLVCVVLFMPVRYEMEASSDGTWKGSLARADVVWLLRLVRLSISYEDKELSWGLRIAWKKLGNGQEKKKTIKTEVKTYDKEMEQLWKDPQETLGEETGEDREAKPREIMERPDKALEEGADKPAEEKEEEDDRTVKELEKELESLAEEQKEVWEEPGKDFETDRKEPEKLLDTFEEEVEKYLERKKALEKAEACADTERDEACEDSGSERDEVREDSGGERDEAREDSGSERDKACEDSGSERNEVCEKCGRKRDEACEDSGREWKEVRENSRDERDEAREDSRGERDEACEACEGERAGIWQKITDICQSTFQKLTGLYRKITEMPDKIRDRLQGIRDKADGLLEKKDKICNFLLDEVHRKAFLKIKDEAFALLRRLKPKKILADVHYGFADPSATGKVLAAVSICYPFLGRDVKICPDFEKKVLDGRLQIKGWLRISYLVKVLWKLVWCREVRMTYRHVRKFEW